VIVSGTAINFYPDNTVKLHFVRARPDSFSKFRLRRGYVVALYYLKKKKKKIGTILYRIDFVPISQPCILHTLQTHFTGTPTHTYVHVIHTHTHTNDPSLESRDFCAPEAYE